MNRFKNTRTIMMVLFALLALVVPVLAQDGGAVTADEVNTIAKKMYCPVCENIPLDVCGTAACAQWRDEIRIQLEQGFTEDAIISDFVSRYGDRVVGTPQDPTLRALSLVTPWVIGALVVVLAGFSLLRWWRGRGAQAALAPASAPVSEDDYRARLERDLQAKR